MLALVFSLGASRDIANDIEEVPLLELSIFEVEPDAEETIVVERSLARAMPLQIHAPTEVVAPPPCSGDASGVFRPPRSVAI